MMASLDAKSYRSKRTFQWYSIWRFAVGFALGTLIALAENAAWLPSRLSQYSALSFLPSPLLLSITGPLLLQTLAVPLIATAGLYSMGYPYTSRVFYTLFWIMRGMDAWNFLGGLSKNDWQPWFLLILLVVILCLTGVVMLRLHTVATAGVALRSHTPYALRPTAYLLESVRLWGALLILQAAFDLLYLSIL